MSSRENWRRAVLESPDAFSSEDRAAAWMMTARQIRERGAEWEWAAEIADEEARLARDTSLRLLEVR